MPDEPIRELVILAAFEPELAPLRDARVARDARTSAVLRLPLPLPYEAHAVGIGLPAATAGAALVLARRPSGLPRLVVLVGTCGAYPGSGLSIGDAVVTRRVHLVAPCALPALGGRVQIPDPMTLVREADAETVASLARAGGKPAAVATTLGVTVDDAAATEIPRATGAEVEHMEAFGVATACASLGVPFAGVLGVANSVGSRAREEWRANHAAASRSAVAVLLRWLAGAALAVALSGCHGSSRASDGPDAGGQASPSRAAAVPPSASSPSPPSPPPPPPPPALPPPKPVVATVDPLPDGGACKLLAGPASLPLRSPVTLKRRGSGWLAVQNEGGRPRVTPFPLDWKGKGPGDAAAQGGYGLPCAVVGDEVFCPDKTGAVHRARTDGTDDRIVASSRAGSRIAAAELASVHTVLGYLASRQTTEGWVSEAWMVVDDGAPERISEDGSGATSIVFAPRGPSVLALTVDARTALTAMHARSVSFRDHAVLGEDVIAFVGGPGDRRTHAALALGDNGPGWSLLPIAKDIGEFGLALVRLDDPPRLDEPVAWSMYPNGLDPAPVAAASDGSRSWVGRVRPKSSEPGSPRLLELGLVTEAGAFDTRDVLPTTGDPADVTLAIDASGALWIAWVDAGGSWIARMSC